MLLGRMLSKLGVSYAHACPKVGIGRSNICICGAGSAVRAEVLPRKPFHGFPRLFVGCSKANASYLQANLTFLFILRVAATGRH